ncbi:MAG: radical SAM-associated putative lipoprotein [Paludibacteraceae bacterium]|nr:radical SAM-associated putative lipoprotein [Paludibacteraceae bacterium]
MKTRLLTGINALIACLLGVLGFTSCEPKMKYATPYAELEATGKVTNERNEPVRSARVTLKNVPSRDGYTDAEGIYSIRVVVEHFPVDSLSILVSDTDGVYQPDSVRLKVDYDRSDAKQHSGFYRGKGYVYQDFQLKEK